MICRPGVVGVAPPSGIFTFCQLAGNHTEQRPFCRAFKILLFTSHPVHPREQVNAETVVVPVGDQRLKQRPVSRLPGGIKIFFLTGKLVQFQDGRAALAVVKLQTAAAKIVYQPAVPDRFIQPPVFLGFLHIFFSRLKRGALRRSARCRKRENSAAAAFLSPD